MAEEGGPHVDVVIVSGGSSVGIEDLAPMLVAKHGELAVHGITREFLFEVGREIGIPVREAVLKDDDLFGADESFLTSTTREVVPIVQVDDRTIGSGKPGPVTLALLEGYRKKAQAITSRKLEVGS